MREKDPTDRPVASEDVAGSGSGAGTHHLPRAQAAQGEAPQRGATSAGDPVGSSADPGNPPILDTRGTWCPLPVLLTERRLAELPAGARLAVLGTDPAIREDVPAWCAETGHRLLSLEEQPDGTLRFTVEKARETSDSTP